MRIDHDTLASATGLRAPSPFLVDGFALATYQVTGAAIGFIDDRRFLRALLDNAAITTVITTAVLAPEITASGRLVIQSDDPRYDFYTLLNHVGRGRYQRTPSEIDATAEVHPHASVSAFNVRIGPRCRIEPGAVILPDVTLGADCVVRAGAVIGTEGFEHKRTSRGILPVFHDGGVTLGDRVEVGGQSAISKGFSYRQTLVGSDTKLDNFVHLAHGTQCGERCLFTAHAMSAGSVTFGDDVWIGPGVLVSNGLTIGTGAFLTIGAVVTRDVGPGEKVSGNFAVPHMKFLRHIKAIASD